MSAEERKLEEAPTVREVGGRSEGFEASGVLFRLPMILLAMMLIRCELGFGWTGRFPIRWLEVVFSNDQATSPI